MTSTLPLLLLAPLACAVGAVGQDQLRVVEPDLVTPSVATESVIPIHTAEDDPVGGAYGTWAVGRDYKASFHQLPTVYPYLGADYPVTRRLGFDTRSITVGGVEIGSRNPMRRHESTRYELHRNGIVEAYDVLLDGLEQTFTFTQPLVGGDLVIACSLDTNLTAEEVRGTPASVDFFDDAGQRILNYGAATVFDASGRQAAVETHSENGVIRLRVEKAWLEDAVYPVVVDPLVSPTALASGAVIQAMDSVRSDVADQVFVTYSRAASATDDDLVVRRISDSFTSNVAVFNDATANWSAEGPQIASGWTGLNVVTAFNRVFLNGNSEVRLHARRDSDPNPSTSFIPLFNPTGQHSWRADIGGFAPGPLGSHMLVVYQKDTAPVLMNTPTSEIEGRVIDLSGTTMVIGSPFTIEASPISDCERPSVNQFASPNGSSTTWLVAYQCYNNTIPGDDWDAVARQVNGQNSVSTQNWLSLSGKSGTPSHRLAPKVAGLGGRYGIVFTRSTLGGTNFKTQRDNGHVIEFERVDWPTGSSNIVRYPSKAHTNYTQSPVWRVGQLGYDYEGRSHWVHTSLAVQSQNGSGSLYIRRAGYQGEETRSLRVAPRVGGQCFAGGVTYDDDNDSFVLSYGLDLNNTATVARFTYPAASGGVQQTGSGCSPATISWSGFGGAAQQIGSEFWNVRVNGAPSGAAHLLVLSLNTGTLPTGPGAEPGCNLLVSLGTGYIGILPLAIGDNVFFRFPLPEFLPAMNLYFQDFHTNAAGNLFQSTQRLVLPITK